MRHMQINLFDEFELLIDKLESLIDMDDPFVVYCSDDDCGRAKNYLTNFNHMGLQTFYYLRVAGNNGKKRIT